MTNLTAPASAFGIALLAARYADDAACTQQLTDALDARGLLDEAEGARAIQFASGGALTFVQAARVQRMRDNYRHLCTQGELRGVEDKHAWAEALIAGWGCRVR
jgi:hypothetical protein